MLIGKDAGSTRMTSTSALLSDEALLRSNAKMESQVGAAEPVGLRLVNRAYHSFQYGVIRRARTAAESSGV